MNAALSNLQLRVISAIVLGAAVLALTWIGGLPFRLLAAGISAAVLFEWAAMTRRTGGGSSQLVAAAALAIILGAMLLGGSALLCLSVLALAVIGLTAWDHSTGRRAWTAGGLAYAALGGLALAFLRDADRSGLLAILFLFAVVWSTDILAYFVGRALGGPKLAPAISPGKTWTGAIGGTAAGLLAGLAVGVAADANNPTLLAVAAVLLSIVSQAGDLFESWVKRRSGVKDSGTLIPGHGGVMDRVDGLVAAAVALWLIGAAIAGADQPARGIFAPNTLAGVAATDSPALPLDSDAAPPFRIII